MPTNWDGERTDGFGRFCLFSGVGPVCDSVSPNLVRKVTSLPIMISEEYEIEFFMTHPNYHKVGFLLQEQNGTIRLYLEYCEELEEFYIGSEEYRIYGYVVERISA